MHVVGSATSRLPPFLGSRRRWTRPVPPPRGRIAACGGVGPLRPAPRRGRDGARRVVAGDGRSSRPTGGGRTPAGGHAVALGVRSVARFSPAAVPAATIYWCPLRSLDQAAAAAGRCRPCRLGRPTASTVATAAATVPFFPHWRRPARRPACSRRRPRRRRAPPVRRRPAGHRRRRWRPPRRVGGRRRRAAATVARARAAGWGWGGRAARPQARAAPRRRTQSSGGGLKCTFVGGLRRGVLHARLFARWH